MKKLLTSIFIMCFSLSANAGYLGDKTPSLIYGAGNITFGIDNPPADLCTYWGRNLTFDATSPQGKNMLTMLLAAKMANKKVSVWYTASKAPGTTQENGCSNATIGILNQIGIVD